MQKREKVGVKGREGRREGERQGRNWEWMYGKGRGEREGGRKEIRNLHIMIIYTADGMRSTVGRSQAGNSLVM